MVVVDIDRWMGITSERIRVLIEQAIESCHLISTGWQFSVFSSGVNDLPKIMQMIVLKGGLLRFNNQLDRVFICRAVPLRLRRQSKYQDVVFVVLS